jgi:hypothetical protein
MPRGEAMGGSGFRVRCRSAQTPVPQWPNVAASRSRFLFLYHLKHRVQPRGLARAAEDAKATRSGVGMPASPYRCYKACGLGP